MLYLFENYSLDTERRELTCAAAPVPLEPQVLDLLLHLIRNRDRVVTRDDLIESVWGGRIISESALGSRISSVRSAIGDNGDEQRLIKTLPRKGSDSSAPCAKMREAPTSTAGPRRPIRPPPLSPRRTAPRSRCCHSPT